MTPFPLVHRIAIISLLLVMLLNIASNIIVGQAFIGIQILQIVVGTAVWCFLAYKIWKRPRKWSLGLGIFLFAALLFQIFLYVAAVSSGQAYTLGVFAHPIVFALWEIPLLVAAVSCLWLRRISGGGRAPGER